MEDYPAMPMGDCLQYHIKLWVDRFPFTAEGKGSACVGEPGKFSLLVTSNYPTEKCFSRQEDVQAIRRRFWEIERTTENKPMIENWQLDASIRQEGPQKTAMVTKEQIDEWQEKIRNLVEGEGEAEEW
jgi:FtsZ-binding cell division protein ZapB